MQAGGTDMEIHNTVLAA